MNFGEFVIPMAVRPRLVANTKTDVLRELLDALVQSGEIDASDRPLALQTLMDREQLATTGVGSGVAIPHARTQVVRRPIAAIGISEQGIDFDSLDGEKTTIFFLLISPLNSVADQVRALGHIARNLQEADFCKMLNQARTAEDIRELLVEADSQQFVAG